MADRRMISKAVVDSDIFLDMPLSTQALYFHLSVLGDDDGFVDCPRKIQRAIGANDDDLRLLVSKGFVLLFESGVIVITHWSVHNTIQKDRYKPTIHQQEYDCLYQLPNKLYTKCIQSGSRLDTQLINENKNNKSRYNQSIYPSLIEDSNNLKNYSKTEEKVKKNIEYEVLIENNQGDSSAIGIIDEITNLIIEVIDNRYDLIINGKMLESDVASARFQELTYDHVVYVINSFLSYSCQVKNPKAFIASALYNSFFCTNLQSLRGIQTNGNIQVVKG